MEQLWDQGVVVIAAAGNLGNQGDVTIKSPGNSRKIITVGSLTDAGTADFSDDFVSSFSSRGPSAGDLVLKPDLVAPGNRLIAAIPGDSHLWQTMPAPASVGATFRSLRDERIRRALTVAGFSHGSFCSISAAAAATIGVAMLVPDSSR